MLPCHIHILLPSNNLDVDGETIVEFIHDILIDGFHLLDDKVLVEFDSSPNWQPQKKSVSVIYDNTWRCQIYVNDDQAQVAKDSQHWSRTFGTDLQLATQKNIVRCCRRLDISCDPDPNNDYLNDFDALLLYLRNTFGPCYTFDSISNKFLHHDTDESI